MDQAVVCGYNPYYEEDYKDPYWTYDIGGQALGFSGSSWYGTQSYYSNRLF